MSGVREKQFCLAVIGCGRWGINHVRAAAEVLGPRFVAFYDADPAAMSRAGAIASQAKGQDSIAALLRLPSVTGIVVSTPASTHYEIAKECLKAGKHVLVEKPLALFSEQARELQELARARGLILMVGHILLYHPAILEIKNLVDKGVLGKLQYLYSNRLNLGTVRREENILWSFAPHDISVLNFLVQKQPVSVEARGTVFLQPGIHDVTLTNLRYPGNVSAHIFVSWLHPFKEQRLVVVGDKSMAVFEDSKDAKKLLLYRKGIDLIAGELKTRDESCETLEFGREEPLRQELLHFVDCVTHGRTPRSDAVNAIEVLEVLEQAQRSLDTRFAENMPWEGGCSPSHGVSDVALAPKGVFVHETATVDPGCSIGKGTKIWHFSHIQNRAQIGENCSIGQNVYVGSNVSIGSNVKIQNNVSVYEGVALEDFVFCGPSLVFTNVINPRSEFPQRGSDHYAPTLVRRGASLGANATILCGRTLGAYCFVGAGAVVTKDVPDYAIAVGNPAKVVGHICRCGTRLQFSGSKAECVKCKRSYLNTGGRVAPVDSAA